jgi:hypothetical protein
LEIKGRLKEVSRTFFEIGECGGLRGYEKLVGEVRIGVSGRGFL